MTVVLIVINSLIWGFVFGVAKNPPHPFIPTEKSGGRESFGIGKIKIAPYNWEKEN